MTLFPPPRKISDQECRCDLSRHRWLVLPGQAGFELKEAARRTADRLATRFLRAPEITAGTPGAGELLLMMRRNPELPPEGFRLEISPAGGCLEAATASSNWSPT